jgi:hypothetical protein
MKMTVGEAFNKIDRMREIVGRIEDGVPIKSFESDIAEFLDEYIMILTNTKVDI